MLKEKEIEKKAKNTLCRLGHVAPAFFKLVEKILPQNPINLKIGQHR